LAGIHVLLKDDGETIKKAKCVMENSTLKTGLFDNNPQNNPND
jgi:hypothetical protein